MKQIKEIPAGTIIQTYEVLERAVPYVGYKGCIFYHCRCTVCGHISLLRGSSLLRGQAPSCKACKRKACRAKQGARFGKLTITRLVAESPKGHSYDQYECLCSCGNVCIARWENLRSGHTKSCGCSQYKKGAENPCYKHGERETPLYTHYRAMKERCNNPNYDHYHRYGGRGITVCPEWQNDFLQFKAWAITHGYKPGLSLDRINNDGNYCPENCRWTTQKQQVRNSSRCHKTTNGTPLIALYEANDIKGLRNYGLKIWREVVKQRANGKCELCGYAGKCDAHHWFYTKAQHSLTDIMPANGCYLCRSCHMMAHDKVAETKIKIKRTRGAKFNNLVEDTLIRRHRETPTAKEFFEQIKTMLREQKKGGTNEVCTM